MKKKEYKISVIIPVYNVEKYLEETIESVVNQTIGFDNIQMILVNDGSPDNSEEICLKYKEKYPDNVVYVKQENAGVSSARNNGLKHATGKYVNFFDSDDIWDKNAYEKAIKFLDSNLSVDLVAFRLKFFEKSTDYHALDYKFTRDGIVDVNEEPSSIVLHVNTAVIRREAIPVDPFDSRLRICEDTKVLYQIILNKLKYGIISSSNYNYRKREDQSSAIQGSKTKVYWYTDTIEYAHKYLIKLSMEKFGKVIPYVQYFIMYELQWRIKGGIKAALTLEQKEMYRTNLRYLMSYIDDTVIAEQRNIGIYEKLEAYFLKYDKNLSKKISIKDNLFYVNNVLVDEVGKIANSIEIFEMKAGASKAQDVFQLFMYMVFKGVKQGKLVASKHSIGSKYARATLVKSFETFFPGLSIELKTHEDYNLQAPATREEREKFFNASKAKKTTDEAKKKRTSSLFKSAS